MYEVNTEAVTTDFFSKNNSQICRTTTLFGTLTGLPTTYVFLDYKVPSCILLYRKSFVGMHGFICTCERDSGGTVYHNNKGAQELPV